MSSSTFTVPYTLISSQLHSANLQFWFWCTVRTFKIESFFLAMQESLLSFIDVFTTLHRLKRTRLFYNMYHILQEFQELSAKRKTASAADAQAHLGPLPSNTDKVLSGIPSDSDNDSNVSSGQEEDEPEESGDEEDESRHEAMLAEVRGAVGDRKRKRVVVASEAYPDSEYNLPSTSASAGEHSTV